VPSALRAVQGVRVRQEELGRAREQIAQARYGSALLFLRVEEVRPNPRNPRRTYDEAALDELAASIKADKQLQPVVVRRVGAPGGAGDPGAAGGGEGAGYELIAGERRWRAAQRAGLAHVWAVERAATDCEAYRLALVENLHREDLSRADKVAALDQLAELAEAVGLNQTARELRMSPGWLSQRLAIRRNPRLFPALERGAISFGVADALQRAPAAAQQTLLDRVLAAPEPTPVAAARAWAEEARAAHRAAGSAAAEGLARAAAEASSDDHPAAPPPVPAAGANPYAALAAHLRALGAPTTQEDRAGLAELAAAVAALGAGSAGEDALASAVG
jgi:ParB family chromosome partitioning protein